MGHELLARVTVPLRDFVLDVELGVDAGATVAVTGLSGSGKTTLLRALAGLIRPTAGRIVAAGEVWFDAATGVFLPVEQRPIGLVFQDYALFPHLDARANVAFPLESAGVSRAERRRRADELLARLAIPHLATSKPATLSGGERQRVAIARALSRQPRLLLLDEPLSSLDPATRGRVTGELHTLLQQLDLATVIVTHSYDDAAALANRVAVIDRGQIVQEGTPEELLAAPTSAFVADFAGVNYLNGAASEGPHGLTLVSFEGGTLLTTELAEGHVGVVIPPWAITLAGEGGSARNSLSGNVLRVARLGNRVRVTVATPRSVTAEISSLAADELDLRTGRPVTLRFKAAECRLTRRTHAPSDQPERL
jgi:molybdate transport system ATP-binding protein